MFTRDRPSKKNDNCFVEQKSNAVVRRLVGYTHLEGDEATAALKAVYLLRNGLLTWWH